jgi:hypothetical protein
MSTVTFKKEAQTYDDALKTYNREVNSHNKQVQAYNDSYFKDAAGNKYVYEQPYILYGPGIDPFTGEFLEMPYQLGNNYYKVDSAGKLTQASKPAGNYALTDTGNGFQALRTPVQAGESYAAKPNDFTQKFTMEKPDLTIGQKTRLDQPNLTDLERNNNGLINSAFNY